MHAAGRRRGNRRRARDSRARRALAPLRRLDHRERTPSARTARAQGGATNGSRHGRTQTRLSGGLPKRRRLTRLSHHRADRPAGRARCSGRTPEITRLGTRPSPLTRPCCASSASTSLTWSGPRRTSPRVAHWTPFIPTSSSVHIDEAESGSLTDHRSADADKPRRITSRKPAHLHRLAGAGACPSNHIPEARTSPVTRSRCFPISLPGPVLSSSHISPGDRGVISTSSISPILTV